MDTNDLVLLIVAVSGIIKQYDVHRHAKTISDELSLGIRFVDILDRPHSYRISDALQHNTALGFCVHRSCFDGSKSWEEYQITGDGVGLAMTKPEKGRVFEILTR